MTNSQKTLDERLQNKWWRLTHLYKIKDKSGALVTFKPNEIQTRHIIERASHRRNLIVKARQFGFTTFYCIDYLDEALWVPGMSCAIIAHDRETLERIFDIVKRAYENFPEELKPRTKTDTVREYDFSQRFDGEILDSTIYVALKLRGGTVQKLHITESAYIKDRSELNAGTKQAVPISGSISEETTGNGFNEFFDFFMESKAKTKIEDLDYKTYFYAWWENPEYSLPGTMPEILPEDISHYGNEMEQKEKFNLTDGQLLWRRWKINELRQAKGGIGLTGIQLFKQEYPATLAEAFQAGAGQVFDVERIEAYEPKSILNKESAELLYKKDYVDLLPEDQEKIDALLSDFYKLWQLGVSLWVLPEKGRKYIIGVDPSDGEGADFSVVDVWDKDSLEQVAQFYGKVRPDDLAQIAKQIADYYNHAFIGVENNMLTTILFLSKIYDNYYYEVKVDEKLNKKTKKIGWNTNTQTRDLMIDDFIILHDEGLLKVNSEITLKEMRTFVKNENGKREHAVGKHDDALFGGFIAMQMRRFYPKEIRTFANKPIGF